MFDFESYIRTNFKYCPDTGILERTDRANSNGSYDKDGYLIIKIKTKQFKAHRICWFLHYGSFPEKVIDHINGNRTDNRICNLRDVEQSVNVKNTRYKENSTTGIVGICFDRTNGLKRRYYFLHNKIRYRFLTLEEAIENKKLLKGE